jgi:hypothetical protein
MTCHLVRLDGDGRRHDDVSRASMASSLAVGHATVRMQHDRALITLRATHWQSHTGCTCWAAGGERKGREGHHLMHTRTSVVNRAVGADLLGRRRTT